MAIASGIAVANIYYIQPLLPDVGRTFQVPASAMGLVVMLGQLGFATGLLFAVPLGDISDRRRLIVVTLALAAVSLSAVALARSYMWLAAAVFGLGVFSVTPQMLVPFAAHLAAPERRGHAVGVVMSGLVIGILVSRAASGYIGSIEGWRAMYWIAAAVTLVLAVFMSMVLPRSVGSHRLPYARLLGSIWHLTRAEPVLRESALAGAMLFATFSAFWSMLAFRLELPPLHYGSRAAGLLSLVGVAGAASAPIAGWLADRADARANVTLALLATMSSWLVFAVVGHTLWGLVTGIVVLDAAVQAGHVMNLSRVHGLSPEARNRLTTVYMGSFFLGGAAGSALGAFAWQRWSWPGVCVVGAAMPAIAALKLRLPVRPSESDSSVRPA